MRLNLRNVLVAVIVRSVKMTKSLCSYMCVCVCASVVCKLSPWKRRGTRSTDVFLSLSPTWNTGNSLFDHYLPVSLPSTGTTCYDYWCATLTGQKHTCKLKHIEKREREKKKHHIESDWCRHSNPSPRRYNHDDHCSVGKAHVYYSILGFQLASVTVRLAHSNFH